MLRNLVVLGLVALLFPPETYAQTRRQGARPIKPRGELVNQWFASGSKGAVASGGPEAVEAGLAILQQGGNAADSTAATLLAQCVTDASSYCFGGEVPIIVYNAQRKVIEVLDGQGAAPRLATLEHFQGRRAIPTSGIESATVPAVLDVCLTLLERHGTMTFARAVEPTLKLLDRKEYPWHAPLAVTIRRLIEAEKTSADDRIRGLRRVSDYFYRGPIARELDTWARSSGSLLRYSDLATHRTRVEDPVTATYRGYTVAKCGPWSQGPVLLQALQILDGIDVKSLGAGKPETIHITAEALKLALADRDVYYADPHFVDVPLQELLSPKYAEQRRALVDREKASLVLRPGDPRNGKALRDGTNVQVGILGPVNDTTTCVVADGQGNVVATTPSGWSGVLAGETGVWLGSRLQSFNLWKGHPNVLEPGKRPRITLTPTLVLKEGRPVIAISVAGGDVQDQVILQLLMNVVDFGMTAKEAIQAPRFQTDHHVGSFAQAPPKLGHLAIQASAGEDTLNELKRRGHQVQPGRGLIGNAVIVTIDPNTKRMEAAADLRANKHAAAY